MVKFLSVIPAEEIARKLENHWRPSPTVQAIRVQEAAGRVLAEDVRARIDVPPFDRARYDGYAVRAEDTFGADEGSPRSLKLVGSIGAGERHHGKLRKMECLEIATGAQMPPGADAVVMVEFTAREGNYVKIFRSVSPGYNVSAEGSDVARGERLLNSGQQVGIRGVGALVAAGVETVRVFKRPKIAVISTGSELQPVGTALKEGKVYDVNGPVLSAAARYIGGEPKYYGIVHDDRKEIKKAVSRALKENDLVVLSGGTSAGAGDLVPEVLNSLGEPGVLVHGVAQKPGKPTLVAVVDGKPIFGLPGYPVSALMIFEELVAPYIRELGGLKSEPKSVRAFLAAKYLSARGRREFVPVKLTEKNGKKLAAPIFKDSGAIASLSGADGYFVIPVGRELLKEGEPVEVRLFEV